MYKIKHNNVFYVFSKTWHYEKPIILIMFLQIATGVLIPFIGIYLPAIILDGIAGNTELNVMFRSLFALLLILTACNTVKSYISSIYETHLLNNKIHFLTDLFRKKMELDYTFIESTDGQNMYQYALNLLLNDNLGISGMLRVLGTLFSNVCSIFLYTGIIAYLDFHVVIALIASSLIHLVIVRYILKKQHSRKKLQTDLERKLEYLFSYISKARNNKDIKMFFMKNWLLDKIDSLINEKMKWTKKLIQSDFLIAIVDIFLLIVRDALAYFSVFYAIFSNKILISQFVLYFGAITGFSAFMTGLTGNLAYIFQRSREVSAFRDYVERDNNEAEDNLQIFRESLPICIEFIHVFFRYEEEGPYVLKDLNLKINCGEKIALVGENGAGKTTLVNLICGLYKPTEGKILINGIDINELSKTCISSLFAVIFQKVYVLPMSAAENIAFGDADKNTEEIRTCIRLSGLEDILSDLKMPMTKMLKEDGIVLSGGQEQKLMLARAAYKVLYKNAAALILDEPTAALDPISERQFYDKYNEIANEKTSVFISHRLASTQFCDRVILLDSGKIVEEGTHSELMAAEGRYAKLYNIQSQYYR